MDEKYDVVEPYARVLNVEKSNVNIKPKFRKPDEMSVGKYFTTEQNFILWDDVLKWVHSEAIKFGRTL